MSSTTHEIVILGGNFAGLEVVHHLFRQTLPLLKPLPKSPSYHVTLVSPSTQYYFKVGAPRAIVKPNAFPQNLLLSSIPDALAQYGPACQFLQGKAVALEAAQRIVSVETSTGETKPLPYNSLFICTGTTSASPLWSIHADHTITEAAVASMHSQLPKTKSVLIAGAGAVGVETAGEIAHNYPNAKVTLVGSVLPRLKPATQSKAKKLLAEARVEMVDALVKGTEQTAPNSTTVQLGNGEARTVEMFIDARGAHKINSDFLPGAWLDKTGRVNTRDAYFRVKGEDAGNTYVVGDIVAGSDGGEWRVVVDDSWYGEQGREAG
ncbi:hypothetical protein EJ04DRAFT_63107 [Polyplosphaeria fusca]|uniref:FAD/NAD(P)-binding domain-containing protein n=1 Tax=Polyplosphaeria fusca TaxID=682080 RepID=A0A9P4QRV5_9PLEO|nr:hypothetical protein EJ04DRAFT_63107 [Polyplosphaeria fusca]